MCSDPCPRCKSMAHIGPCENKPTPHVEPLTEAEEIVGKVYDLWANDGGPDDRLVWQRDYAGPIKDTLDAARRERDELKEAARKLSIELNDEYIKTVRHLWGNTNAAVLKHWRDALREVLVKLEDR
jgi:hypothetical protein